MLYKNEGLWKRTSIVIYHGLCFNILLINHYYYRFRFEMYEQYMSKNRDQKKIRKQRDENVTTLNPSSNIIILIHFPSLRRLIIDSLIHPF